MSNHNALIMAKNTSSINTALTMNTSSNLNVNNVQPIGTHLNLFDNQSAVNGTNSNAIDLQYQREICIYGDSSAVVDLHLEVSPNNTNWYDTGILIQCQIGDFYSQLNFPGRYLRVQSEGISTLNATLSAK